MSSLNLTRFGARPVRLFRFAHQSRVWRFAQAKRDIVIGADTYLAAPIERDEIRITAEPAKDKISIRLGYLRDPAAPEIDLPSTQSLGDLWHPYIPSDVVSVMCLATDYGSTEPPDVQWMGVVAQPSFTDVELELACEPGHAIAKAANQGPKFQRGCWKEVYSTGIRGCNLDPAPLETVATLTAVSGADLTAAEFAGLSLSLLGGEAKWTDSNGQIHRRMIVSHSGTTVRIHYGGPELAIGLAVTVKPNCEQTYAACSVRHADPQNHYGGAIYMPVENPMDGVSMSW